MKKKISKISVLLSFFLLSTPFSVLAENEVQKEIVKEQTYVTRDKNEERDMKFDTQIIVKDKKYKLKDVKYEIVSDTPVLKEREDLKVITTDVKNIEETYEPEQNIEEGGISYYLIDNEKKEVVLQNSYTQTVSGTTTYQEKVTKDSIPSTKSVKEKNKETGIEESVTCKLTNFEELAGKWVDTQIEIIFENYDADYYEFQGVEILKNDNKPALQGYEKEILQSAGVDSTNYKVLDVNWKNDEYEKNGIIMRDAVATCQRLAPSYRATYSGEIIIPEKKGYVYTTTYKGLITEISDQVDYEIKAVASYSQLESVKKNDYTVVTVVASIGIIILVLLAIFLIYKYQKKSRK